MGWPERVYSRAMEIAMADLGLVVQREMPILVHYRGDCVGSFRADTVVDSHVILEYKASGRGIEVAEAQLMNYLRGTRMEVGLLLKFLERPAFKRCFLSNDRKDVRAPLIPTYAAFKAEADAT